MKITLLRSCLTLAAAPLMALSVSASACGQADATYMGSICATGANFCPQGYLPADGRLLEVSQYQALYALLGTSFGGDGRVSFQLPDLRGRTAVGAGTGPGLSPVVLGQRRGVEVVTETIANLPTHTHVATATGGTVAVSLSASQASGSNSPQAGDLLGAGGTGPMAATIYVAPASAGTTVALGGVTATTTPPAVQVANAGASEPVFNLPPQQGVTYCVAVQGVFPPRP